jgi:hypothetical protein
MDSARHVIGYNLSQESWVKNECVMTWRALCHVIGYGLTQEGRIQNVGVMTWRALSMSPYRLAPQRGGQRVAQLVQDRPARSGLKATARLLAVAAQVEFESKVSNRFIIF